MTRYLFIPLYQIEWTAPPPYKLYSYSVHDHGSGIITISEPISHQLQTVSFIACIDDLLFGAPICINEPEQFSQEDQPDTPQREALK